MTESQLELLRQFIRVEISVALAISLNDEQRTKDATIIVDEIYQQLLLSVEEK